MIDFYFSIAGLLRRIKRDPQGKATMLKPVHTLIAFAGKYDVPRAKRVNGVIER